MPVKLAKKAVKHPTGALSGIRIKTGTFATATSQNSSMIEASMRGLTQIAEDSSGNAQEAAQKATEHARQVARLFLRYVTARFDVREAFLFGTHARYEAQADSDVDVAVVLNGQRERLTETVLLFSNIAYDVFMETSVLIDAHPLWNGEWDSPGMGPNPCLVENIKRDGVRL